MTDLRFHTKHRIVRTRGDPSGPECSSRVAEIRAGDISMAQVRI